MNRRNTKQVYVKDVPVGGGSPIAVQTMWKMPLSGEDKAVLEKINTLKKMGCDILRFAVPDNTSAKILGHLSSKTQMPLVADIHFDHRLALTCMDYNIAKIRINPGNIGEEWKVSSVIEKAKDNNIPLRIGVNSGSLPKSLKKDKNIAEAMVKAAETEIEYLEKHRYHNVIFSLKSSDIETTVLANKEFSEKYDYPLHLGVTEAGPLVPALAKSAIAFDRLLNMGIGDTIRVSISDSMEYEIEAAIEILSSIGLRENSVTIISCPRCGRATFDTHAFTKKLRTRLIGIQKQFTIAIMGCVVNGPGEAEHADIGISGIGNTVVLFKHGKILKKINEKNAIDVLMEEIHKL